MFELHAIRVGVKASQMHPVVDPNFRMRDDNGELSALFRGIWKENIDYITELSTYTLKTISELEQDVTVSSSPGPASSTRSPTMSAAQPSRTIGKKRSLFNLLYAISTSASGSPRGGGVLDSDLPPSISPSAGPLPGLSAPGSLSGSPRSPSPFRPSGSAPSAAPATAPPSPSRLTAQFPVIAALQEFSSKCKLHPRYWLDLPDEEQHFPLLKGPVHRKAAKKIGMNIRDHAGGASGGQMRQ